MIATASAFLRSALGKDVMFAVAALVLATFVGSRIYHAGGEHERRAEAHRLAVAQAHVVKREAAAVAISDASRAKLNQAEVRIVERTRTLIEKVPVYVDAKSDDRCDLPVGFVLLHDAAASGSPPALPPAAGGSDAPSGVALSAATSTIVGNYGEALQWRAEADAWRQWYARQLDAWGR